MNSRGVKEVKIFFFFFFFMLKSVLKCSESIRIIKKWVNKFQNLNANLVGGGVRAKLVKSQFFYFC